MMNPTGEKASHHSSDQTSNNVHERNNNTMKQKFMSFNDHNGFVNNNKERKSDSAQISVDNLDNVFGLREFID